MKGIKIPAILLTRPPVSTISTSSGLILMLTFGIASLIAFSVVSYPFWVLKSASRSIATFFILISAFPLTVIMNL